MNFSYLKVLKLGLQDQGILLILGMIPYECYDQLHNRLLDFDCLFRLLCQLLLQGFVV